MMTKLIYGTVIGCLILLSGFLYVTNTDKAEVSIELQETAQVGITKAEVPMIVVYVTGEVVNPDVYEVPEHSRLYEVIEVAGGFLPDASKDALNLARFVFDGERIYVSKVGAIDVNVSSEIGGSSKVSINQATIEELITLTGIGMTKAKAIIEYRESNGPFQKIEDIMKVNGIKDAMYNKIKNEIVI